MLGMPKLLPSPRSSSRSRSHHATSSSVVTSGVMTSFESARSASSREISPASAKAAISDAVRRARKSERNASPETSRAA